MSQFIRSKVLIAFLITLINASAVFAQYLIDIDPDQSQVIAGTNVSYDIDVMNMSGSTRNNAKVVTTLPDNVSFLASNITCDTSLLPVLTCPLGNGQVLVLET